MKHFLLVLALAVGCAHSPVSKTTDPPSSNPFTDILGLLGDIKAAKPPTLPCLKNGCTFYIKDEIDEDMAKDFSKWIESAKENHVISIEIILNTPGGSVEEGFNIIHAIEAAHKEGVLSSCKVDGDAMSMGFNILQSCDYRNMTKRSSLMSHEIRVKVDGMLSQTKAQNMADMLRVNNRAAAEHCVNRMKITMKEYLAKTTNGHEWFMDWEEALKVGAIDMVVGF